MPKTKHTRKTPIKSYKKQTSKTHKKTKTKRNTKMAKSKSHLKTEIGDEMRYNKSLSDFIDRKSISIVSRLTDIKETSVRELSENPPIHTVMMNQCIEKVKHRRYLKPTSENGETSQITKSLAAKVCNCLFEKNKDLSINELEDKVLKKEDTPASDCITILDKHFE